MVWTAVEIFYFKWCHFGGYLIISKHSLQLAMATVIFRYRKAGVWDRQIPLSPFFKGGTNIRPGSIFAPFTAGTLFGEMCSPSVKKRGTGGDLVPLRNVTYLRQLQQNPTETESLIRRENQNH